MKKQHVITGLVALSALMAGAASANSANATVGVVSTTTTMERPINTNVTSMRPATGKFHRVQSGDTLNKIAHRYNVSLQRLMHLNNLHGSQANHIKVGQLIRIS